MPTSIVYYGESNKTAPDEGSGEDKAQAFRFLKTYAVFNVAQIDGLPERFHILPETPPEAERTEAAEAFFASIPATVSTAATGRLRAADRTHRRPTRTGRSQRWTVLHGLRSRRRHQPGA